MVGELTSIPPSRFARAFPSPGSHRSVWEAKIGEAGRKVLIARADARASRMAPSSRS